MPSATPAGVGFGDDPPVEFSQKGPRVTLWDDGEYLPIEPDVLGQLAPDYAGPTWTVADYLEHGVGGEQVSAELGNRARSR